MKYTILGKSGLDVSRIAFGTWQLGGDWGATDTVPAIEAIRRAADRGVTLFDTAQGYGFGQSERALGGRPAAVAPREARHRHQGRLAPGSATASRAMPARRGSARGSSRACAPWPPTTSTSTRCTGPTPPRRSRRRRRRWPSWSPMARSATSACRTSTSPRWRPSVPPCRSRRCNPRTTCSAATSRPRCCPTRRLTTSASWSTDRWPTGLLGGHLGPDTQFAPGDWRAKSPEFHGDSFARNLAVRWTVCASSPPKSWASRWRSWQWRGPWHNPAVQVAIVGTRNPDHVDEALAAAEIDLDDEVMGRIDEIMTDAIPVAGPSPEAM